MKKVFGGLVLGLGVVLLLWVGFNLFVSLQPQAQGKSPIPALILSAGLLYVGVKWLRSKS